MKYLNVINFMSFEINLYASFVLNAVIKCVKNFMICYHITLCRNHAFDDPKLFGKRQRKSKRSDISQPSAVCRGCLPVRQHHRCDESKILPTTRLGIPLQDNLK